MNIVTLIEIILGRNIRKRKFDSVVHVPTEIPNQVEIHVFKYRTAPNINKSMEIHNALTNFVSKGHQLKIILDGKLNERDLSEIFCLPEPIVDKYREYLIELKELLPLEVCSYRDCYLVLRKENTEDIINEFMAISYPLTEVDNDTFNDYIEKREREKREFLKSIKLAQRRT